MHHDDLNIIVLFLVTILLTLNIPSATADNPSLEEGPCYVIADTGDVFGRVENDGSITWIGPIPSGYGGGENLAIDPSTGYVYNIAGEPSGTYVKTPLIIIDPETVAITEVNEDTTLWDVDALAFNPHDGLLYAVNKYEKFNNEPGILQLVDKTTGVATKLVDLYFDGVAPATGVDPHVDGISFDPENGDLYGIYSGWGGPSHLVTIDMTTGLISVIGDTGAEDIEDICFKWDGVLVGALGSEGEIEGSPFEGLVVIDKDVPSASKLGVAYGLFTNYDVESFACTVLYSSDGAIVGGMLVPAYSPAVKGSMVLLCILSIIGASYVVRYRLTLPGILLTCRDLRGSEAGW